ncbi:hypothetical protein DC522_24805 [Microvirga sp. KLBC 81]|uniref:hypothetical protein n=1 Tax=Microvirga sp. KLBC 81 TaxID=1862707 RepID=UPI000D51688F|nr:hypothetical protein [Microvirga sp. KLBC 81]PVE21783.1 hypothetical protein DC522_24805 [Microvirga sp. KLBC 81]
MTKTVTSLFHSEQHAMEAARRLEQAGIPGDRIDIWSTPHNLAPLLEDAGVSRSDAYAYVEGVLRGGSIVIVSCADHEAGRVGGILDHEGVLDLDKQRASWRSEGWQENATAEPAGSLRESSRSAEAGTESGYDLTGSPDMTRARADMAAGGPPDEVSHGRIRIQARKVERPVQK